MATDSNTATIRANDRMTNMASATPRILPLPSGANRLSYAIPMPYIPSPPR